LVICAAEGDTGSTLLDECYCAVFEFSAAEALGVDVAYLFDFEGCFEGCGVLEASSYEEYVIMVLELFCQRLNIASGVR